MNEESDENLSLPTLEDVEKSVASAKLNSINEAERCSIILPEYSDHCLTGDNVNFIDKIDDGSDDEEENYYSRIRKKSLKKSLLLCKKIIRRFVWQKNHIKALPPMHRLEVVVL